MFDGGNNKKLFVMICIGIIIWLIVQFYTMYNDKEFIRIMGDTHEANDISVDTKGVVTYKSIEAVELYNQSTYSILKLKKSDIKSHLIPYGSLNFISSDGRVTIDLYELDTSYLSESYANIRTQFIDKHVVGKLKGIYFLLDDELLKLIK